jgi:hypothetical protein
MDFVKASVKIYRQMPIIVVSVAGLAKRGLSVLRASVVVSTPLKAFDRT